MKSKFRAVFQKLLVGQIQYLDIIIAINKVNIFFYLSICLSPQKERS